MKRAWMLMAVTTFVLLTTTAAWAADGLPTTKPEAVGLSSERLKRLGQVLQREVDARKFPGAVALVARKGKIAYFESFGVRDPKGSAALTNDSIFRVYSMTKPWTSVAIMMLVEEGRLVLTDPVWKFLPQLKGLQVADATGKLMPAAREMTIQDLLRHTSGLTYGGRTTNYFVKDAYKKEDVDARELTNAELIDRVAKVPLVHQPGTAWEYSRSTDVLGRVVEVIAGTTLGGFLQERIMGPLKMADSGFWVPNEKHARLAGGFATHRRIGYMLFDGEEIMAVEVATARRRFTRETGILEYWVVDCVAEAVEIHRTPAAGGYRDVTRVAGGGAAVSPDAFPDVVLTLAEVFA